MRICLYLDPSRLLRWHLWAAEILAERIGDEVFCRFASVRHPIPTACILLLEVERMIYGSGTGDATVPMDVALRALPSHTEGPADITVDFVGDDRTTLEGRVLTPLFNGIPGEIGVIAAMTEGLDLEVELQDDARPQRWWKARPASADRALVSAGLDSALSCAVALITKAVREVAAVAPEDSAATYTPQACKKPLAVSAGAIARSVVMVAWKATKLLNKLMTGGPFWSIGWRLSGSTSLLDTRHASFNVLSGRSRSYLADPFPFHHRGRQYIFFEQFSYAADRGCIAVAEVEREGGVSEPRIVLQEPHHLSYPHIFERDGQIWMLPEAGASGNVDLYRAAEFPFRWEREARLAAGIEAYDTTPLDHGDHLWFFTCLRAMKSSSWDMLALFHADGLTGAWTPHAGNPVMIDAVSSRPAGAFIRDGGRTLRPAQDCGRYYGRGLTLCRIDTLNETTFAQTAIGRIDSGRFGCHTYNRNAGLEVIDLWGRPGRRRSVTIRCCPLASAVDPILAPPEHAAFLRGDGRERVADDPV
jgi:hypothetical protein